MKRIAYLSAAAGLVALLAAGSASAKPNGPTLTLDDGTTQIVVDDNSRFDTNKTPGIVSYTGSIGNWDLSINNGFGQMGVPGMHLSSTDMMIKGSGSLMITLSEIITESWSLPKAENFVGGVFGSSGATGTFMTKINGIQYGTMNFDTTHGLAFSGDDAFSYLSTGNDLVEICAMITSPYTDMGVTSFDYGLAPVPEPGTFLLFGVGALALAIYSKRRHCPVTG